MLGFSPLSQGPVGTSGVSGNITVPIDVQTPPVQATGQVGNVNAAIPVTVVLSGWNFGAWGTNLISNEAQSVVVDRMRL